MTTPQRWAWAEINLAAVAHNVRVLGAMAAPSELWAVVKADGYGHGSVRVGQAALAAGAVGLCVALTQEGVELRAAGITAPILVLSEQPADNAAALIAHRLTPTVYTAAGVEVLAAAVAPGEQPYPVHVKVDTGMHRVGVAPADLPALLQQLSSVSDRLRVDGIFTHLAVADDPTNAYNLRQLAHFESALPPHATARTHAANSAGLMAHPPARRDMVRGGIAIYGICPGVGVNELATELQPVLALKARVSFVKRLMKGDAISYGLRHTFESDANVATVPIGYADGVPRRLSSVGGQVLIGGKRRSIVGVVTMDQLMVDCGDDPVEIGHEVVLIGRQANDEITANDWANQLETIPYEIVCNINKRIPKVYENQER